MSKIENKLVNRLTKAHFYKDYANCLLSNIDSAQNRLDQIKEKRKKAYYNVSSHAKVEFNRVSDKQKVYIQALYMLLKIYPNFSTKDLIVLIRKHPIKFDMYKKLLREIPYLVEEVAEYGISNVYISITENLKNKEEIASLRRKSQ